MTKQYNKVLHKACKKYHNDYKQCSTKAERQKVQKTILQEYEKQLEEKYFGERQIDQYNQKWTMDYKNVRTTMQSVYKTIQRKKPIMLKGYHIPDFIKDEKNKQKGANAPKLYVKNSRLLLPDKIITMIDDWILHNIGYTTTGHI